MGDPVLPAGSVVSQTTFTRRLVVGAEPLAGARAVAVRHQGVPYDSYFTFTTTSLYVFSAPSDARQRIV